ncbi:MAG: hypothetical protein ACXABO_06160 [Promethearchaeota archaeon]|jgi:hypothetical protein
MKKNKKKKRKQELETILKQFDEFQYDDTEEDKIKGRLLAYIPYANRVLQQYENTKHKYLRLNISFLAVINQAKYARLAIKTRITFSIVVLVYFIFFFIPILIIPFLN